MSKNPSLMAFAGDVCVANGEPEGVRLAISKAAARQPDITVLVFDAVTGEQTDLGESPAARSISETAAAEMARGPGRPKLGVVAREVTLLPRHWDWLASQPGGASVALRKLVEHGMRASAGKDRIRASQNAAYRFMTAVAGNRAGFEAALRALFAGDAKSFDRLVGAWPKDIRDHARRLAADALAGEESAA